MSEKSGPTKKLSNHEYLALISKDASTAFQDLRKAVGAAGPLDENTCELIALGAFATARIEDGFKVHARRLLREGVDIAALRQSVLVTMGATTTFNVALQALRWIDEISSQS